MFLFLIFVVILMSLVKTSVKLRGCIVFSAGLNFKLYFLKNFFYQQNLMGTPLIFWPKLLPGGTLCKFFKIFPPKDLVYIGRKTFHTF